VGSHRTPARSHPAPHTLHSPCSAGRRHGFQNVVSHCILRGSNSRGLRPLGLKSSALTTRPRMRVRSRAHNAGGTHSKRFGAPRVRLELTTYRLTAGRATDCAIQELACTPWLQKCPKKCTACGDRTRDQSIKSRTLYLTELRRPVLLLSAHPASLVPYTPRPNAHRMRALFSVSPLSQFPAEARI
jgi:hypothetical protein